MRISFCEVDGASGAKMRCVGLIFQSSFMRISFCEDYAMTVLSAVKSAYLNFQSSFMRISFCECIILVEDSRCPLYFQSSFMRISFCEYLQITRKVGCSLDAKTFNPLLWGFLFARGLVLRLILGIRLGRLLFFQSSFMRISFCESLLRSDFCTMFCTMTSFQSSFMRISFCEKRSITDWDGAK